ncbi:MAG: alanine racemase [Salinibacterium sp.]|nr:alanine racemase [Salinibacterium sp.]
MHDDVIGPWAKSFPASSWGMTRREYLEREPRLSEFATPLLTIDASAAAHNVALMAQWLDARGLEIAPHGKTTMAPQLWQQLLDGGAWGITLATGWQVQLARSFGVGRIILANQLIDPVLLRWLATALEDPSFEFMCWVDSLASVELMRAGLAGAARPVDVVVELGSRRTGARTVAEALAVVTAVNAAPELRLVGVGGYEGSAGSTRSSSDVGAVRFWLDQLVALHDAVKWERKPIVTAGGSAYFDLVAEALAPLVGRARVILRSGAYQLHDAVHYARLTPLAGLRSAIHGWSRVLSTPEPGLAILDGGKRDFPYDLDLPVTEHGALTQLNDQHGYLSTDAAAVGDIVRLSLSHPCTAMDKWRLVPVIDDASGDDPRVVNLVHTYF